MSQLSPMHRPLEAVVWLLAPTTALLLVVGPQTIPAHKAVVLLTHHLQLRVPVLHRDHHPHLHDLHNQLLSLQPLAHQAPSVPPHLP
jgi:hypothetical protein